MKRGRKLTPGLREWILEFAEAHEPNGFTLVELQQAFRKTDFSAVSSVLDSVLRELNGQTPDKGYGRRLYVARYTERKDRYGTVLNGGKRPPVFRLGNEPDAQKEPPSRSALYQREFYAKQRALVLREETKIADRRRRELNRKPAMDLLTAALFRRT